MRSLKKVFLKLLQNSQEDTCVTASKKRLWHRYFSVNFKKILRTPFFHRTPPMAASVNN